MSELTALPALLLAALLRDGEVSAREVAASYLTRLDALDPRVNAVVARDDEAVGRRARWLDDTYARTGPVGPLHGVPFTAKDWLDAVGLPCAGEGPDPARRPAEDATSVARLRAAGAVLLAKTNVGVDHRHFGPCRNPVDPLRSAGGSSSGEAAVLTWGGSAIGLGSDSGGSIRLPAAWCGVVGLKPSHGLVPLTGHYPRIGAHHDGRTVIGPLVRSVDDAWLALRLLAGPDGLDPGAVPVTLGDPDAVELDGLRVAPIDAVGADAAELLATVGAHVSDPIPDSVLTEAMDITQRYWHRTELTGAEVDRWLWDWDRFRRRMLVALASVDVVVGPTVSEPAPLARTLEDDDFRWTVAWSLTGSPALSLPIGRSDTGLPLAVQVVARPWHDHVVIATGRALEAACDDEQ